MQTDRDKAIVTCFKVPKEIEETTKTSGCLDPWLQFVLVPPCVRCITVELWLPGVHIQNMPHLLTC